MIWDVVYVNLAHRNSNPPNKMMAMARAVDVGLATDYASSNSNDYQTYDAGSPTSSALYRMNLVIGMRNFVRRSFGHLNSPARPNQKHSIRIRVSKSRKVANLRESRIIIR